MGEESRNLAAFQPLDATIPNGRPRCSLAATKRETFRSASADTDARFHGRETYAPQPAEGKLNSSVPQGFLLCAEWLHGDHCQIVSTMVTRRRLTTRHCAESAPSLSGLGSGPEREIESLKESLQRERARGRNQTQRLEIPERERERLHIHSL